MSFEQVACGLLLLALVVGVISVGVAGIHCWEWLSGNEREADA